MKLLEQSLCAFLLIGFSNIDQTGFVISCSAKNCASEVLHTALLYIGP